MLHQMNSEACVDETMFIDGERVEGSARLEVRNPARPGDLVGTIVRGTSKDIDNAVTAAKRAQRAWAELSFAQRAEILAQALARAEAQVEACTTLFVRENGKPLKEARGEIIASFKRQNLALSYAAELDAGRSLGAPNGRSMVLNRPYGVVVSIVPWNSPIILGFTQIVAALLAGNCVVLKPPESCPLALIHLARTLAEGLPRGALNIVTGLPGEIGDTLTSHRDVSKIGFTGSIPAARHIMSTAAQTIKGLTLELGGNDAAIILDDADLGEKSIHAMIDATFHLTGQVCMAIKRVYVPTDRREEFMDRFCKAVDSLVVGDGLEPHVSMGPLHTKTAQARAQGLVEDSQRRGARIETLGKVHDAAVFAEGYFIRPSVVTKIGDDAPLMVEEQFCPVLPVVEYDDVRDAVARANNSIYGLGASVWSRDVDKAIEVARNIEAGQVWINAHGPYAINHKAPYGGMKQSGVGRKSGIDGILEYIQTQTITTRDS